MEVEPIAYIQSPYPTKFGVPRQPGLVTALPSRLELPESDFEGDAGSLGKGDFIWLVWDFSFNHGPRAEEARTVRAPRLGGTRRVGVFASRSSFRPNNLALSSVKVQSVERKKGHLELDLGGADLVDGTPIYLVAAYSAFDCHEGAHAGWLQEHPWKALRSVEIPDRLKARIPGELWPGFEQVLLLDPRPAYTKEEASEREFWVPLYRYIVRFRVKDDVCHVIDVEVLSDEDYERLKRKGSL